MTAGLDPVNPGSNPGGSLPHRFPTTGRKTHTLQESVDAAGRTHSGLELGLGHGVPKPRVWQAPDLAPGLRRRHDPAFGRVIVRDILVSSGEVDVVPHDGAFCGLVRHFEENVRVVLTRAPEPIVLEDGASWMPHSEKKTEKIFFGTFNPKKISATKSPERSGDARAACMCL